MRERILELQRKAVEFSKTEDEKERFLQGIWLHQQLAALDNEGVPAELRVEFMAAVKIMLDEVLPLPEEEKKPEGLWLP